MPPSLKVRFLQYAHHFDSRLDTRPDFISNSITSSPTANIGFIYF